MKTQNQIYTTLAATLLLLLFAGQASAQSMRDDLLNFLPADDPYCGTDATGTITIPAGIIPCQDVNLMVAGVAVGRTPAEIATDQLASNPFPVGVVDWVLVEVREAESEQMAAAGGSTVAARKPALLLSNGRVVDAEAFVALGESERTACLATTTTVVAPDPCPPVSLSNAAFVGSRAPGITGTNSAFLVVRHRNHLDIQSARSVPIPSNLGDYDFSDEVEKTLNGSNGIQRRPSAGSNIFPEPVYAMRTGDFTGDGNFNNNDNNGAFRLLTSPADEGGGNRRGYFPLDVNLDSNANTNDRNNVIIPLLQNPLRGNAASAVQPRTADSNPSSP